MAVKARTRLQMFLDPGNHREIAAHLEPSDPGVWYLSFASAENNLGFGKSPFLTIRVTEPPMDSDGGAP